MVAHVRRHGPWSYVLARMCHPTVVGFPQRCREGWMQTGAKWLAWSGDTRASFSAVAGAPVTGRAKVYCDEMRRVWRHGRHATRARCRLVGRVWRVEIARGTIVLSRPGPGQASKQGLLRGVACTPHQKQRRFPPAPHSWPPAEFQAAWRRIRRREEEDDEREMEVGDEMRRIRRCSRSRTGLGQDAHPRCCSIGQGRTSLQTPTLRPKRLRRRNI